MQGYFGGKVDLIFQRFIEIWTSMPLLYLLIILAAVITPSFFILLFILLLFKWTTWWAWCARNSCVRELSNM